MPKRTHKLRKNKPYLGPPLPDDIIRMILMHATHSGATVRVVCKAWLRISNSLTPFFINRMNAMQIALTKQAAMRKPTQKNDEDDEDDEEMAECESVVALRLMTRTNKEIMGPMLAMFGVPLMLHGDDVVIPRPWPRRWRSSSATRRTTRKTEKT